MHIVPGKFFVFGLLLLLVSAMNWCWSFFIRSSFILNRSKSPLNIHVFQRLLFHSLCLLSTFLFFSWNNLLWKKHESKKYCSYWEEHVSFWCVFYDCFAQNVVNSICFLMKICVKCVSFHPKKKFLKIIYVTFIWANSLNDLYIRKKTTTKLHIFFIILAIFSPFPLQPMMIYAYSAHDPFNDILPTNNEDGDRFSSMELSTGNSKNSKREASPIFGLIMDILDTFYTSSKADAKRSQFKGSRYTK